MEDAFVIIGSLCTTLITKKHRKIRYKINFNVKYLEVLSKYKSFLFHFNDDISFMFFEDDVGKYKLNFRSSTNSINGTISKVIYDRIKRYLNYVGDSSSFGIKFIKDISLDNTYLIRLK